MQVNGWVLGIGSALALVTTAQAQVRQPTIQLPPATGVQIAALKSEVDALKASIAQLKIELAKERDERTVLDRKFYVHYHSISGDQKLNTPTCPNPTGGGYPCSKK